MTSEPTVTERVEQIRRRIAEACSRSGRNPGEITLLGASKSQPVERMRQAWSAGVTVFGENRVQEALGKMPALPREIDWHLIGPLQTNKVKKVVPRFSTVHSVDRIKLANVLETEARKVDRVIDGFLEVNLGGEETKHGFLPDELPAAAEQLTSLQSIRWIGLMGIPPFESDPGAMRAWFRRLRQLRDDLRPVLGWQGAAGCLSMGMSQDFEIAIEEGATHVRIGTDLFGPRMDRL
jgi:pyridoxal phosphate enzyme (YggS family)